MAEKQKHTLTMIAGELEMNAKSLRAILRKKGYTRPGTRWVFTTEEKNEIKALVKKKAPVAAKKAAKTKGRTRKPVADDAHAVH